VDPPVDAELVERLGETEAGEDDADEPTIEDGSAMISSPAVAMK
jgi:hypothetical protein